MHSRGIRRKILVGPVETTGHHCNVGSINSGYDHRFEFS
jgi:hypothetical protein